MNKKSKKILMRIVRHLLNSLQTIFVTVSVCILVFTFVLKIVFIDGTSMEGTLESGDCVFASVRYGKPEQGDIVIINDYAAVLLEDGEPVETEGLDKYIVKRVIATEGQTVDIDFERGAVYVDGEMLDETYITGLTHLDEGAFTGEYPVVVPENCCFVMGDNRGVSKDSRSSDVGFVPERCIEAKVFFRLSPYDKIGFID